MEDLDKDYLFSPDLLLGIDWTRKHATYKNGCSPTNPGENLLLRPLHLNDFYRGFNELLSELTTVGDVSFEQFEEQFRSMQTSSNTYYIAVVEDSAVSTGRRVVGCTTLLIERKFIHSTGIRGRIEDVVILSSYRGKQLGKLLVEALTLLGHERGCYKVSLECNASNVPFYEAFDYAADGQLFMVQRFQDNDKQV